MPESFGLSSVPSTLSITTTTFMDAAAQALLVTSSTQRVMTADNFETPRAVLSGPAAALPEEGRAGSQSRTRAAPNNDNPFEDSGVGGLTLNLAKKLAKRNGEAVCAALDNDVGGDTASYRDNVSDREVGYCYTPSRRMP